MKNNKSRLAFSLLELSVVIVVIGIMTASFIFGSSAIAKSKLKSARSLTAGSPVNSISKLALWLESTSKNSFSTSPSTFIAPEEGEKIHIWYDRSTQTTINLDASQTITDNQPIYISNAVNNLPALKFYGINDYLSATSITNPGLTNLNIFIVAHYYDAADNLIEIMLSMQNGSGIGRTILQKINTNNSLRTVLGSSLLLGPSIDFTPTIYQVRYQNDTLYLGVNNDGDGSSMLATLEEADGDWTIASNKNFTRFMHGYFAEIIVFNKSLDSEERDAVLKYLSRKWGIKLD
jgi:prepilin-type N-terminal cleavage/methylation domain-containing protein